MLKHQEIQQIIVEVLTSNNPQKLITEKISVHETDSKRMGEAIDKFGKPKIDKYLRYLYEWVDNGAFGSDTVKYGSYLFKNRHIGLFLDPPKKPPEIVYRGLYVPESPVKGQKVVYTSKKPYTSWSSSRRFVEKNYATFGGIVLAAEFTTLSPGLFIWPFGKIILDYVRQVNKGEWCFKIIKPIPIVQWKKMK